jgi:hypothetical protein
MQRTLDRQRRAAHRRRQARTSEVQEQQPEPEEESKDESIAVSRRILESNLIQQAIQIFKRINKKGSRLCNAVSYPVLTLFASVMRDIPTSIPDLADKGLISVIIKAYSEWVPPEENYLKDVLLGMNGIVLHSKGCELAAEANVMYAILQTLLKEEYSGAMNSIHSEACEETAKQLLSLYSQAELLRPAITNCLRNLFLGLDKRSEIHIKELADSFKESTNLTRREEVLERCTRYLQSLRGIVSFIFALIQNEGSADHKKLLNSLNEDCILVKSILKLLTPTSILGLYVKGQKKAVIGLPFMLKVYINDVFNNKDNTNSVMRLVSERINQLRMLLGSLDEVEDLGSFLNGTEKLNIREDEPIRWFPEHEQVMIMLASIESTCEVIKILGVDYNEQEALIEQLNMCNKLLLREIVRLSKEGLAYIKWVTQENKKPKEEHKHYSLDNTKDEGYKIQIDQTYQTMRRFTSLLTRAANAKRKFESGNEEKYMKTFQVTGRLVSENIEDLVIHLEKLRVIEGKKEQMAHVLYGVLLLEDIKNALVHDAGITQLINDFIKAKGIDNMLELYQILVTQIFNESKVKMLDDDVIKGLNLMLTLIMSTFEKFLDPDNVRHQLVLLKSRFNEKGFKTPESYISSITLYIWEGLLLRTKYYDWDCVKFLAEHSKDAFEVFLEMLGKNADKKNTSLAMLDSKGRRESFFSRGQNSREESAAQPMKDVEQKEKVESLANEESELKIKIIDGESFPTEISKLLGELFKSLYKELYLIHSQKFKRIFYNLVESQESTGIFKVEILFAQLLNELQTVLFSLEFTFSANLIPIEEGMVFPEIDEVPSTKDTVPITKIEILIDIILTFINYSKTGDLVKILCDNRCSGIFIAALYIITKPNIIWENRELIPKILVMLSRIYKDTHSQAQLNTEMSDKEEPMIISSTEEVKQLMIALKHIIEYEDRPDKEPILTKEVLTLTLLVIHNLAKNYEWANEIQSSGIMSSFMIIKNTNHREKIPSKLFTNTIFNLFESSEVLYNYMARIISSVLYAKAKASNDKKISLEELCEYSEVLIEDFIESMNFISVRNPLIFVGVCKEVTELHKVVIKKGDTTEEPKYYIALNKTYISKIIKDRKQKIPEIPLNSPEMHAGKTASKQSKATAESKNLTDYKSFLQNAMKDGNTLLSKTNTTIIQQMMERLIDLHFLSMGGSENKQPAPPPDYVVTQENLLETLGELVKTYPETISFLFSFKSAAHPKIVGPSLVSFLIRSLFPWRYIDFSKGEPNVADNETWRNTILAFIKHITYEAKGILTNRQRILLSEMRRRILLELLTSLSTERRSEITCKGFALLYSSLSIFEGLFYSIDNSLIAPLSNAYMVSRLCVSTPGLSLIKICMDILRSLNFNSSQAGTLSVKIAKILERLTLFNTQGSKTKGKEDEGKVLMNDEDSDNMQDLNVDPMVREVVEREQEYESESIEEEEGIHSEEYIESSEEVSPFDSEPMDAGEYEHSVSFNSSPNGSEENEMSNSMEVSENRNVPEQEEEKENEERSPQAMLGDPDSVEDSPERSEMEIEESVFIGDTESVAVEEWDILEESEESNMIQIILPDRFDSMRGSNDLQFNFHSLDGLHSSEQHSQNIGIDVPPQQREMRSVRFTDIYERTLEEPLNIQMAPYIRSVVAGEDESTDTYFHRIYLRMQFMRSNSVPVLINRADDSKKRDTMQNNLCGEGKNRENVSETIKNQIAGGLVEVVEIEREEKSDMNVVEEGELNSEEVKGVIIEEVKQPEEKKEEAKRETQITPEQLATRRAELEAMIPGVQVDDSLLAQIDPDFLRALSPALRLQAIEPFIVGAQNSEVAEPLLSIGSDSIEIFPINRKKEVKKEEKEKSREPLEEHLKKANEVNLRECEIIESVMKTIKEFDDKSIESILRLLYLNTATKIPINALIGNICHNKQIANKIIDALLFILVHHSTEELKEKHNQDIATSVHRITLTDTIFPPPCLYNGMDLSNLTHYILPLRIFSLLSYLLRLAPVVRFFLPKDQSKRTHLPSLASMKKLKKQVSVQTTELPALAPLIKLFSLVDTPTFRMSVLHLEALIQFVVDLFKHYEENVKKNEATMIVPKIDSTIVKQVFKIFYLEILSNRTYNKLTDLLARESLLDINARMIIKETGNAMEVICQELLKDWEKQSKCMEDRKVNKSEIEQFKEEISLEHKLVRIIGLLKSLYKMHTKKGEEEPKRIFRFSFEEEDSIREISPTPLQKPTGESTEEDKVSLEVREKVMALYDKPILADTFYYLTDLISTITNEGSKVEINERNQLLLKLTSAIEALIIAYNHMFNDTTRGQEFMKQIKEAKRNNTTELKSKLANALYKFLKNNKKAVNNLIRQLEIQSFLSLIKPFIVRFPYFLDFDNKRAYFRNELRKSHKRSAIRLNVNRANVFIDSYNQLAAKPAEEMMGRLRVSFRGENAVDAGGVTREWFTILSRAMFNPDFCLFKRSAHGNTYQPDPKSGIETNHINYFHFIGRIIGKALLEGMYLDCFFTRAFYKTIVGQSVNIHDLEDSDVELYNSLVWVRENDPSCLEATFSYALDYFGELQIRVLKENGRDIPVTNENKDEFIIRMCKAKLYVEIKSQMESLLKGLYEIIPKKLVSIFDDREIELLISGLPDIDIFDLKRNTEYYGYHANSNVIKWLWEILESYSTRERAEFLQFVTGTSKVPLDGFKSLPGASGVQKFQIHRVDGDGNRLPAAHTCFNQLDLPEYPSKEVLQERLLKAIKDGSEYMGLL